MNRLIQIASQELGLQEIPGDHRKSSPRPTDVVLFRRESRQLMKSGFKQSSVINPNSSHIISKRSMRFNKSYTKC